MDPVAREVRMAAVSDRIMDQDDAMGSRQLSNDYFAPGAAGSVCQKVARFWQFKRAGQTMDAHVANPDSLRRKAESNMQMRGASPETLCKHLRRRTACRMPPTASLRN